MNATPDFDLSLPTPGDLAALMEQVWASFVGEELVTLDLVAGSDLSEFSARDRIVASVSITGPWCGHLTISIASAGAAAIASSMFELPAEEVEPTEVADAFGEVANVAGGNVKAMLPEPSTLSLPQVTVEANWISLFSASLRGTAIMQWREFPMDVSLWATSAPTHPHLVRETDAA